MNPDEALRHLADQAGIEARYWDIRGTEHVTAPDTMRALLSALGYHATTDADVTATLAMLDGAPWRNPLPPCLVVREGEGIDVPLRLAEQSGTIRWTLTDEAGESQSVERDISALPEEESKQLGERRIVRRRLQLSPLAAGYHTLRLESGEKTRVIVAPGRCHLPPPGRRYWGIAAQLYALKTQSDWGIGDFSALGELAKLAAARGADAIGLNPLHALFLDSPRDASPYSPASRLFRNPLYLDIEAIPDFAQCRPAQLALASSQFASKLESARAGTLVDYETVAQTKLAALETLYTSFVENHVARADARGVAFQEFRDAAGRELDLFATFQMLSEHFGTHDWTRWPAEFRDPNAKRVAELKRRHADRVGFYAYLQWLCEEQLSAAAGTARAGGMAIGLYNDLAVSIDGASADHWGHQDLFASTARVGAPPDPFNESGQDWGVVPLNPGRLRATGFAYWSALLRANMRHAGALRIDHVMGWQRLYLIPQGAKATGGAYVRFPLDEMLAVAALESRRHQCALIGEDLGTVPGGFRERMAAGDVLSCRVLFFERDGARFRSPQEYPPLASVSVSTHDLATLRGYWEGKDIEAKASIGLFASPEEESRARAERETDRQQLLHALAEAGLLPEGRTPQHEWSQALAIAVHRYLARSPSLLMMVQLDDLAGQAQQTNLPGSTFEYPNWRRRLECRLKSLLTDPRVQNEMSAVAEARAN